MQTLYTPSTFHGYNMVHSNLAHWAKHPDAQDSMLKDGTAEHMHVFTYADDEDEMEPREGWFDDTQMCVAEDKQMSSSWKPFEEYTKIPLVVYKCPEGLYWVREEHLKTYESEITDKWYNKRKAEQLALANCKLAAMK